MLPSAVSNQGFKWTCILSIIISGLILFAPVSFAQTAGDPQTNAQTAAAEIQAQVDAAAQAQKQAQEQAQEQAQQQQAQEQAQMDANAGNTGSLSAQDMITHIVTQIPNLMRLITAIAYVMGMYFIFQGVLGLKHYGDQRTMMSGQPHLKGPLIFITIGALLLYLPTSVQVGISTFWTEPNPYGYLQEQDQWSQFINSCYMVVQLFGVIAFIRGLVILTHLGGHGGQPGTFGKGMTHIIGGILCINIYQFVQLVMVTLGIQGVLGG
jgi:intracellular multiplication protein IcmC